MSCAKLSSLPFKPIQLSLSTISCAVNVQLNDKDATIPFKYTDRVIEIKSNFYKSTNPEYTHLLKRKSKTRALKVPEGALPRRERKKQGDGSCMQSCVSFVVRSHLIEGKVYDIKHFNTGKIQIPGRVTESMDDVQAVFADLVEYERTYFPHIQVTEQFYINMINYNFMLFEIINKAPEYVVRLEQLYAILTEVREGASKLQLPAHPALGTIKYEFGDPMMYINFSSPTERNPNKHIVLSVSHYGKCNIQGGHADKTPTTQIYEFALAIFRMHPDLYVPCESHARQEGYWIDGVQYMADGTCPAMRIFVDTAEQQAFVRE